MNGPGELMKGSGHRDGKGKCINEEMKGLVTEKYEMGRRTKRRGKTIGEGRQWRGNKIDT